MLTLYGGSSPNVKKVSIMLEELMLEHDFRHVNVGGGEQYAAEFAELNPMRKIPVLVDPESPDGEPCTVFESGAILIYLAEKSGQFLPSSGPARYAVLQWLMAQMASIGPSFGQFTHFRRFARGDNDYALSRYETQAVDLFEIVDGRLAQSEHLAGEAYSIADMAAYPWMANRHNTWGGDLARFPNVQRWLDQLTARPAVQRMLQTYVAIDAELAQNMTSATEDDLDRLMGRGRHAKRWCEVGADASRADNIYDQMQRKG